MSTDPAPDPAPAPAVIQTSRERFVGLWGQMGSRWGIQRAMAEVHALLFIVGEPMNADEVMEALQISRGGASTTLRALVDWGVVHRDHRRGDRREYFVAEQDVWKMFRTIMRERKKREIDPLLEERACRQMTDNDDLAAATEAERSAIDEHETRLDDLIEFMSILEGISQRFVSPTGPGLRTAARLLFPQKAS